MDDDVLLLEQGGQLLLTDGTDLLLAEQSDQPTYRIEGRRLIRTET